MKYYVYILKSIKFSQITYVGWTNNLKKRLKKHNSGKGAKFTRGRKWNLIYYEKFNSKKNAMKREYYIKKIENYVIKLKTKINI